MKAIKRYEAAIADQRALIDQIQKKYLQKRYRVGNTRQVLEERFALEIREVTKNWGLRNEALANFRQALLRGGRLKPLNAYLVRAHGSAYRS